MAVRPRARERRPRTAKGYLLRLALVALPGPILFWLIHHSKRRPPGSPIDRGVDGRAIALQDDVELLIAWQDTEGIGSGPVASLYVFGEEVMRLDCFGGDTGHMHFNPTQQHHSGLIVARQFFPPGSRAEHIDRAAFELAANTQAALLSNRLGRIRNLRIDEAALARAAEEMRAYMTELLGRHASSQSGGDHGMDVPLAEEAP